MGCVDIPVVLLNLHIVTNSVFIKFLRPMKKAFILLAATLLCGVFVFSSCQKSGGESPAQDKTPAFVQINFSFPVTADLLKYTDMTATYNDGTGEKTETITAEEWTKALKVALPCTLKFKRTTKMKAGVELTSDVTFAYKTGYIYSFTLLNASGADLNKGGAFNAVASATGKGDKVAELIASGRWDKEYSFSFDKDGNLAQ